jgi:hypothetical protein
MKLSNLIDLLQTVKEEKGDLQVEIRIQTNDSFDTILKINPDSVSIDNDIAVIS